MNVDNLETMAEIIAHRFCLNTDPVMKWIKRRDFNALYQAIEYIQKDEERFLEEVIGAK